MFGSQSRCVWLRLNRLVEGFAFAVEGRFCLGPWNQIDGLCDNACFKAILLLRWTLHYELSLGLLPRTLVDVSDFSGLKVCLGVLKSRAGRLLCQCLNLLRQVP